MTRAKRYANHAGGHKYDRASGKALAETSTHPGAEEKLEASDVFREVWLRCREHEGYLEKKQEFLRELRERDRAQKQKHKAEGTPGAKRKAMLRSNAGS